jgi:hypothetical protein
MEFKMKKFFIVLTLCVASVSSFAEEAFCKPKEALKIGTYGALAGAAASLLIPGAGPVIATSIVTGTLATTTSVAVCAFDEADRKDKLALFNEANKPTAFEKAVVTPVEDRSIKDKAVIGLTLGYAKAHEGVSKVYDNLTK